METQVMKSASLKSAFIAGVVNNVSAVRENTENGYKFVTVLDKRGGASNIYFGKKSAEVVEEGDVLTKDQMLGAEFVLATNAEGESRIKLSLSDASDYTNLANIFDDITISADHEVEVLKALKAVILTKAESEALIDDDNDEDEDAKAKTEALAIREARKAAKAGK
jgi:hypothetical protein